VAPGSRFPDLGRRVTRYRVLARTFPDWLRLRARLPFTRRHQAGRVHLAGLDVEYPDFLSIYAQFREIHRYRYYEFQAAGPAPRVIDAGGYVGLASLFFKRTHPGARITTFEPDPRLVQMLRGNLERNGAGDVEVVNAALGSGPGQAGFVPDGADGGRVVDGGGEHIVEVVPLSRWLDEPVDFLKLDVEGSEVPVLEEAGDKLRNVAQMVIEFHSTPEEPQRLARLLELLEAQGFRYLVNHVDYVGNAAVRPPFRPPAAQGWNLLVYAAR
jgi:FkbM family methyltransferase